MNQTNNKSNDESDYGTDYGTDAEKDEDFEKTFQIIENFLDSLKTKKLTKKLFVSLNKAKDNLQTLRSKFESLKKEISLAKRKSWCTVCSKEADLYCCLWVLYCSEECRVKDWETHHNYCQNQKFNTDSNEVFEQLNA